MHFFERKFLKSFAGSGKSYTFALAFEKYASLRGFK